MTESTITENENYEAILHKPTDFTFSDDLEETEQDYQESIPQALDGNQGIDEQEILLHVEKREMEDVFDFSNVFSKNGEAVAYSIKKEGKVFVHKRHPYSWEKLQAEFGGGHYTVTAKLPQRNNKYIKSQTLILDDLPKSKDQTEETSQLNGMNPIVKDNTTEIISSMTDIFNKQLEESRRQAKENQDLILKISENNNKTVETKPTDYTSIISALAPLIAPLLVKKDDTNQIAMMMDMQRNNSEAQRNQMETTLKLIENQNNQMKDYFQNITSSIKQPQTVNNDALTALELMTLQKDAEDRGFDRYKLIEEIAETKAKEKRPSSEKSLSDTLINSLAPVLGAVMGNKATTSPTASTVPTSRPTQPRGELSSRTKNASTVRTQTNPNKQRTINQTNRSSGRPLVQNVTNSGCGSVLDNFRNFSDLNNGVNNETLEIEKLSSTINTDNQKVIGEVIIPVLLDAFSSGEKDQNKVADNCLDAVIDENIDLLTIERDFHAEVVNQLIEHYGLPENMGMTIKETYELFITKVKEINA